MADIFLSYAREDEERAAVLAGVLTALGWSVFWDRKIIAGTSWDEVVEREITSSKCVVVLWSAASVTSRWVRTEASFGLQRDALVPASLDRTDPPLAFRFVESAQLQSWTGSVDDPEFAVLQDGISQFIRPQPAAVRPSIAAGGQQVATVSVAKARFEVFGQARRLRFDIVPDKNIQLRRAHLLVCYQSLDQDPILSTTIEQTANRLVANKTASFVTKPFTGGVDARIFVALSITFVDLATQVEGTHIEFYRWGGVKVPTGKPGQFVVPNSLDQALQAEADSVLRYSVERQIPIAASSRQ